MEAVSCSSASSPWSHSAAGTQAKVSSTVSMGERILRQFFQSNTFSIFCAILIILNIDFETFFKHFSIPAGKRCTRLSKSDIRVQIVHSDHNATRGNDDEEDVKEPMVNFIWSLPLYIRVTLIL